jgi:hypothetical protein
MIRIIERKKMSEYHIVETEFKDQKCLIETLQEMGYHPEVHNSPQNLFGYQGDRRKQKAHIIIRRNEVGFASNDVGFERVNGKFLCHASAYDYDWREGEKIKKFRKMYTEKSILKVVRSQSKYSLTKREEKDGKIKIRLRRL